MFDNSNNAHEHLEEAFRKAVDMANAEQLHGSRYRLKAESVLVDETDQFSVSKSVCGMMQVIKGWPGNATNTLFNNKN